MSTVDRFDQAVVAFLNGDHSTGTAILQALQETPGGIAETLLTSILLSPSDRVLGNYAETGVVAIPPNEIVRRVQRHFYAFRLISVEICNTWDSKWSALSEELLTFIHVNYVSVNGELLTSDATALSSAGVSTSVGKPLLAEYASLAAIIWKLRAASALSNSEDVNLSGQVFAQLRSQLFSPEFLFQHTPYSHRGMVCAVLIAIVEEFGLFHKASIQRCIPFRLHEATRKKFLSEVLAHCSEDGGASDSSSSTSSGMLQLCMVMLADERDRCQSTLGDGGDPEPAIIKFGEVVKVLLAPLSWRFEEEYFFDSYSNGVSDAGHSTLPTSLEISGDNKNDAAWTEVLAAPVRPSSGVTADAPLSRLVAPLRDHLFGGQAVDPTQVSELAFLSLVGSSVAMLGGLQCAEYAKGTQRNQNIDETISVVLSDILACLVQLSSVCCKFWSPEQRGYYGGHCWSLAMRLCDSSLWSLSTSVLTGSQQQLPPQPISWRIAGCQALFRVITSIGCQDAIFYHPQLCSHFITPLKDLSLHIIGQLEAVATLHARNWADESAEDDLLESLDLLLQGWLRIMQDGAWNVSNRVRLGNETVGTIARSASEVLQAFVTAKVKIHSALATAPLDEASETNHAVEYANSNLQLLATIGRESAESSAYLSSMVAEVATGQFLNSFLNKGQEPPEALSEAVWYVISICAEFVGDAPESERPCIAMPFASQAMRLERQYPDNLEAQIANSPFFSMCSNVLSFTEILVDQYLTKGVGHVVSPGVCAALLEFFRRYIGTFVFADESQQSDYSPVFDVVFDSGASIATLALKLSIACLQCFTHNSDVVDSVGKLFATCMTLPPQFSAWMFASQGAALQTLCTLAFENWVSTSGGPMLSGSTRGKVLAFLISVSGDASSDAINAAIETQSGNMPVSGPFGGVDPLVALGHIPLSSIECPLKALFGELHRNVQAIVNECASMNVSTVVLDVLVTLRGGMDGLGRHDRAAILLFKGGFTDLIELTFQAATYMFGITGDKRLIVNSAQLVENVVGFCIPPETFQTIAELASELCSFTEKAMEDSRQSVQNASSDMKNFEEDERIAVLTSTSNMIAHIASWAVVDFSDVTQGEGGKELVPDLVVKGLLTVLRYLDESTALIPDLRSSIFALLNEVGSSYSASLLKRCTDEDSNLVLNAIQFASTSGVPDLIRTACTVMKAIAKHAQKHNAQHLAQLTQMFLQRLTYMMLHESLHASTLPSVASALFELVELLGLDALRASMEAACSGLSGQHVNVALCLCQEYGSIDRTTWRRAMGPVNSTVEKCVLAAQGGRVL